MAALVAPSSAPKITKTYRRVRQNNDGSAIYDGSTYEDTELLTVHPDGAMSRHILVRVCGFCASPWSMPSRVPVMIVTLFPRVRPSPWNRSEPSLRPLYRHHLQLYGSGVHFETVTAWGPGPGAHLSMAR